MAPDEKPVRRILLLTWIGRALVIAPDEKPGWKSLLRSPKFWSGLILVLVVGANSFRYEDIKHQFPWLISWQLETYNWISPVRESHAQFVVGVEIDDRTFYGYLNKEGQLDLTGRSDLATLVKVATEKQAAVIALDINLDKMAFDDPGGSEVTSDKELEKAIKRANEKGIPIVLVFGFQNAKDGDRIPSLFLDDSKALSLPDSPSSSTLLRGGFDHAPDDRRKVPLKVTRNGHDYTSFALQIVDAYETKNGMYAHDLPWIPRTQVRLREQLENREFVYTSYLEQSQFSHVSATDFLWPWPKDCVKCDQLRRYEEDLISNKIVLIGGSRHRSRGDFVDWLDSYPSPVGDLRGMYFQANYVEGLLDPEYRIWKTVPNWLAAFFDMGLAALVSLWLGRLQTKSARAKALFLVVLLPIVVAFAMPHVSFRGSKYALDFMLPLVLLCLHPALERCIELFKSYTVDFRVR
jgi:CHASE2 domain-containing sensor protein